MLFRLSLVVGAVGTLAGFLGFALILDHGISNESPLTWIVLALPFVMLANVCGLFLQSRKNTVHDGDKTQVRLTLERRLRAEAERWRSQLPQLNGEAHLVNLKFNQDPIHGARGPAHGELESAANYFASLTAPRLVVLGDPGAGKTVLARELQRQMLTGAKEAVASTPSSVPVLVSAGVCEPGKPWADWLAGYLARTYALPHQVAEELVRDGQILPIVDGLDELGPFAAILVSNLNASDSGVVITCRSTEYKELPRSLDNACLIYIETPSADDIRSYLPSVTEASAALRDVLSRPLMLSLADTVYPREGNNGSLSDLAQLPDATAIERVLLSEFLTSVYPQRGGRWPRERAERWLVSIGEQMRLLRADSYTWRSVAGTVLPRTLGLVGGAVIAAALLAALVLLGVADGAFWHGHWVRDDFWPAVTFTVVGGSVAGRLVKGTAPFGRWLPGSGLGPSAPLAWWRRVTGYLVRLTLALIGLPIDVAGATSVRDDLRRARGQALAVTLLVGMPLAFLALLLIAGLVVSGTTDHPPSGGIIVGVCYCLAVTVLLTPWGAFQLGRAWYAVRRLMPYRLMGFLEDAHQHGVLRSAGLVFEFRDDAVRRYATDPARLAAVTRQVTELTDWVLAHPEISGSYQYVGAARGDIEQAIMALASRTIGAGETFSVSAATQQAALEQVRLRLNELSRRSAFDRALLVDQAPGLGAVLDPSRVIPTETMADLSRLIDRTPSSSVGISGLRGIGKSTLIRWLCVDRNADLDFPPLGLLVSAPVEYDARDFLVQLYISLCEAVLGDQRFARRDTRLSRIVSSAGLAGVMAAAGTVLLDHRAITGDSVRHALWSAGTSLLWVGAAFTLVTAVQSMYRQRGESSDSASRVAATAEQQLRRLRYQLTETTGQTAELNGNFGLKLSGTRSRAATENHLTLPELVASYRKFAGLTVSALQERAQRERAGSGSKLTVPQVLLVVGIDEIDRIEEAEKAEKFLNDVKAIFGIPNCFYAASLSADALANFERRVVSTRTAFDTTFDTVLRMGPLDLSTARGALERRTIGMTYPFIALCYVLSGGVPRELMRVARTVFEVRNQLPSGPGDQESVTCGPIAFGVIRRELLSLRQGLIPLVTQLNVPGATALVNLLDDTNGWPSKDPIEDLTKLRKAFADPSAFADESGSVTGEAKVCDGLAAAAYMFLTIGQIFEAGLDQTIRYLETYEGLSEEEKADSVFALLAKARGILGVNPPLAITRVQAVRALYVLDDMAPPLLSQFVARKRQT